MVERVSCGPGRKKMLAVVLLLLMMSGIFYSVAPVKTAFAAVTIDQARQLGKRVSGGGYHTLAVKLDGTVVAWGDNSQGQCNVPAGLNDVVAVAAGERYSVALKSDGTVVAWGSNSQGQCNVPAGLDNVIAITSGGVFSVALKSDGTVVAWGYNYYGQCDVPAGLDNVTAISASVTGSMALKSEGTVVNWGYWDVSHSDMRAIAAGYDHYLMLRSDGTLQAFGYNSAGQCNQPAGFTDVVALSAGWEHSMALKSDGTVVAWGSNSQGQCNVPAGLSNVVAISSGEYFSLALKSDGTVVAWGSNSQGQCNVPAGLNLTTIPSLLLNSSTLNRGTLNPGFDPEILDYTVHVPNIVDSLDVSAILAEPLNSQLYIQGTLQPNGVPKNIPLSAGPNLISLEVPDDSSGLTRTYRITVNREAQSNTNAYIYNLTTSAGVLSPAFTPATNAYTISVDNNMDSINITATTADSLAAVNINGQGDGFTGIRTVVVPLAVGDNSVPIIVRAGDLTTTREYTVNVVRATSNAANLSALSINSGTLLPGFSGTKVVYAVNGLGEADQIEITATPFDLAATLTIKGQVAEAGVSKTVYLNQGANLIPLVVTAPDGVTERAYIISVNGTVSNSNLSNLSVNPGGVSFASGTTAYNVDVDYSVTDIELQADPSDSQAIMLLNGSILPAGNLQTVNLEPGVNTIQILVVAQDASTKTYTITINREEALAITTSSLPISIVTKEYSAAITAEGGAGGYTWTATGLPSGLNLDPATGNINGITPSGDSGTHTVAITVTDSNGATATRNLSLSVNRGYGNGAYLIESANDPVYTAGMTADGIPTMTVNEGVSGYKCFAVTVTPVTGHSGNETAVFVHTRAGIQMGISAFTADYDAGGFAVQAAFNVRAGDIIKVFIVDRLTNETVSNPNVL